MRRGVYAGGLGATNGQQDIPVRPALGLENDLALLPQASRDRSSAPGMAVTVTLEPAGRCRWDEPVRIAVRSLAPGQPVTLRASLRDEKDALFRAHARYCADAHGQLDLERAPALGGSFAGLEPMGLLWALEPEKPFWRFLKRDVQTPFEIGRAHV